MSEIFQLKLVADAQRVAEWNDKRRETSERITRCARELAARRGFDEFTLDELADAAEVSRRTLFNYFPGKMDAVLGLPPASVAALLDQFLAGGPSGDLLTDASTVARAVLEDKQLSREDWLAFHEAFERNPKMLAAAAAAMRQISDDLLTLIARRESTSTDEPEVIATLAFVFGLFDASVRAFIRPDNTRPLTELFEIYEAALRGLVAASH